MVLYNAEVLSTCPNVVKLDITKRKKNSSLVIFCLLSAVLLQLLLTVPRLAKKPIFKINIICAQ
jgi:hypothetical protein